MRRAAAVGRTPRPARSNSDTPKNASRPLRCPDTYRSPRHWHSVIEHVTVLAGTLNVGMGEVATYSGGTALNAGSFAAMPAKMVHSAWAGPEGVTFQLHSVGPWSITYVKAADDPRTPKPAGNR